ncbi:hypothetical protein F5878DRAFT_518160, partial [Lentinula raphanica]
RRNYKAFVRPSVPEHRLEEFSTDPIQHGPGIRCTWIDKRENTTKGLADLPWNKQLLMNLVKTARDIVSEAKDDRFGDEEIQWIPLLRERLYRIFLASIKSIPR